MDNEPLWTYEGNQDAISEWLDGWLNYAEASPADILIWAWLDGEAGSDADWTRDKELSEWIEASRTHRHAWEGVQRLLRILRAQDQPLPLALLVWALDVADETRKPPKRRRGRDARQNEFRNRRILIAIGMLQSGGLPATSNTGRSACHVVANKLNISYEAVRTIWCNGKNTRLSDYLNMNRGW